MTMYECMRLGALAKFVLHLVLNLSCALFFFSIFFSWDCGSSMHSSII
jgi:hypothetical protein